MPIAGSVPVESLGTTVKLNSNHIVIIIAGALNSADILSYLTINSTYRHYWEPPAVPEVLWDLFRPNTVGDLKGLMHATVADAPIFCVG